MTQPPRDEKTPAKSTEISDLSAEGDEVKGGSLIVPCVRNRQIIPCVKPGEIIPCIRTR